MKLHETESPDQTRPYIGTQVSLIQFLEHGVDPILDLIQETCGVNALRIHADDAIGPNRRYLSLESERPIFNLAGLPVNPDNYCGTHLLPRPHMGTVPAGERLALLEKVAEGTRRRGIELHARVIIGPDRQRPGFSHLLAEDADGNLIARPCWNHPDYRGYIRGLAEDLFKTSPIRLDGWLQMNEDEGPLSDAFFGHMGKRPACFCPHCLARADRERIDSERARLGFRELSALLDQTRATGRSPRDGSLAHLLRMFIEYPEILAWQRMQQRSNEECPRKAAAIMKMHQPEAKFGHHVIHHASFTPVSRASYDYARLAEFCDHLCPLMYHTASGERAAGRIEQFHETFAPELSRDTFLAGWLLLHGLQPERQPEWDSLAQTGFDPTDYVATETRRVVQAAGGRARVISNVGWEWEDGLPPGEPRETRTYAAVTAAIGAGATGIFLSRGLNAAVALGKAKAQTQLNWNAGGEKPDGTEGDIGPKSLAAYRAALRDAGWI